MNNYERGRFDAGQEWSEALVKVLERNDTRFRASGNYVANREVNPTKVTFANGRTVKVVNGHLVIGWSKL